MIRQICGTSLTGLSDDTGVALVDVQVRGDLLPQIPEDVGATREVERGELGAVDTLLNDLWRISRNELDDRGGHASFEEDLVDEVVRVRRHGRGLPHADVAHDGGRADEVAANGREVEWGHGEDEAFKGAELGAAGSRSDWVKQLRRSTGTGDTHFQTPAELRGGCWA